MEESESGEPTTPPLVPLLFSESLSSLNVEPTHDFCLLYTRFQPYPCKTWRINDWIKKALHVTDYP
jgi:hypothetical protein